MHSLQKPFFSLLYHIPRRYRRTYRLWFEKDGIFRSTVPSEFFKDKNKKFKENCLYSIPGTLPYQRKKEQEDYYESPLGSIYWTQSLRTDSVYQQYAKELGYTKELLGFEPGHLYPLKTWNFDENDLNDELKMSKYFLQGKIPAKIYGGYDINTNINYPTCYYLLDYKQIFDLSYGMLDLFSNTMFSLNFVSKFNKTNNFDIHSRCILREIKLKAFSQEPIYLEFLRFQGQKIVLRVPLRFHNMNICYGVKRERGFLVESKQNYVDCWFQSVILPEYHDLFLNINVRRMGINTILTTHDINFPSYLTPLSSEPQNLISCLAENVNYLPTLIDRGMIQFHYPQ